jgi:Holliday junction resolvase RusA-like endonuclease
MINGMTHSEMIAALKARGIEGPKAEQAVARKVATEHRQSPTIPQETRETVTLPLTLTIPWSCLVSDNRRYSATVRGNKPLLVLSTDYRDAKNKIEGYARRAVAEKGPTLEPVEVTAKVYLPDHRRHDISNFAKICHDSLEGIVFRDDNQITKLTWEKAGRDVDHPRAEIVISRYVVSALVQFRGAPR